MLHRCVTMRLASFAALCALAACSTTKPAPAPTQREGARPVADAVEERMIKVEAFDCERQESFPGEPRQSGLVAPGHGIRGWHAGGPDGANWNVDDLRCTVRVKTTCSRGDVDVALRVGRTKVAEKKAEITGSHVDVEIVVPFKKCKGNFDDQKPARRRFDTAVFRAFSSLSCTAPFEASWKDSDYTDITDEDMFVAGFARGE